VRHPCCDMQHNMIGRRVKPDFCCGMKLSSTHRCTTDKAAYATVVCLQSQPHLRSIAQQPLAMLQLCMLVLL